MLVIDRLSKLRDKRLEYFWREVEEFLAPAVGQLRQTFMEAIDRAQHGFDAPRIEALIRAGEYDRAVQAALGTEAGNPSAFIAMRAALQDAASATAEAIQDGDFAHIKPPKFKVRFDQLAKPTTDAMQHSTMEMVSDITNSTARGLRTTLLDAVRAGRHPDEAAEDMRDALGLTDRDALAVANYRNALEAGTMESLSRQLRDRRFDRSVRAKTMNKERIRRAVKEYKRRLIAHRAGAVARTEAARGFNLGQDQLWRQAARQAGVTGFAVRHWLVAPGERTCNDCLDTAFVNRNGVGLDEPFVTPFGPSMLPPLHPLCRCVITMDVDLAAFARSMRV